MSEGTDGLPKLPNTWWGNAIALILSIAMLLSIPAFVIALMLVAASCSWQ